MDEMDLHLNSHINKIILLHGISHEYKSCNILYDDTDKRINVLQFNAINVFYRFLSSIYLEALKSN